nr:replication protein A 70 kDa DNA-binding subunit B-like [Ipomoea batatas]
MFNAVPAFRFLGIVIIYSSYADGEARICSSFDATQLFFNHSCKEFRDLKKSFNSNLTPLRCIDSTSKLSAANLASNLPSKDVVITSIQQIYSQNRLLMLRVLWTGITPLPRINLARGRPSPIADPNMKHYHTDFLGEPKPEPQFDEEEEEENEPDSSKFSTSTAEGVPFGE